MEHEPLVSRQPRVVDGFLSEEECAHFTAEIEARARGKPMRCSLDITTALKQRLHKVLPSDAGAFRDGKIGSAEDGKVPAMWQIGSVAAHRDRFRAGAGNLVDGYVAVVYLSGRKPPLPKKCFCVFDFFELGC